jgi:hypothetical protein
MGILTPQADTPRGAANRKLLYNNGDVSYSIASSVPKRRSKLSIAFTSSVRVLFTTLLFTAGGMGAGLFLGILGTVVYGMIRGSHIDMTNAYRHVAIPSAILTGSVALIGSAVLEVRARRTRTSL